MTWYAWLLVIYWIANTAVVVGMIGKTIDITRGYAAFYVLLVAGYIATLLTVAS